MTTISGGVVLVFVGVAISAASSCARSSRSPDGHCSASATASDRLRATSAQCFDQVQVNGAQVNPATGMINGFDGASVGDVYDFDWLDGSDADIAKRAATPGSAIVEAQFAKQHGVAVGEPFELQTPSGRRATFTALATYRDPMIGQGLVISPADFRRRIGPPPTRSASGSSATVDQAPGPCRDGLAAYPSAKTRTTQGYRD